MHKLKANWSMEAQQDLQAMHNVSAENTLAGIMAQEIQSELDQEILDDLRNFSVATGRDNPQPKKKKRQYRSIDDPWEA